MQELLNVKAAGTYSDHSSLTLHFSPHTSWASKWVCLDWMWSALLCLQVGGGGFIILVRNTHEAQSTDLRLNCATGTRLLLRQSLLMNINTFISYDYVNE
jgi:hypothetical protein